MEGQTMRDWRRDEEFYRKAIEFDDGAEVIYRKRADQVLLPSDSRTLSSRILSSYVMSWSNSATAAWLKRYSFGISLDELRSQFFPMLATFIDARRRVSLLPEESVNASGWFPYPESALPDHYRVLRLVSLGVCLGVGPVWVEAVVGAWPGSPGGHDRLLDRLVASAVPDRQIGTVDAAKRPAYGLLASAFDTDDPDEQVAIITKYLGGWYKQCRGFGWWNAHTLINKQGSGRYSGYWCFEAAAVISVLGLDADRFDSEYLPKDLAAWRSQHPDLIGTSPSPDEVDLDSVIKHG
ncbi:MULTISPECIES: PoNe immunity protein domain-containing protein [unclassified Pseudoclavibacter]|uniref:PoNe immunity protein domain-containing protein n=1 Tax=unclassified Pseudoclavibacter TaxID=2615177 RepID=UPI001300FF41|nr:MULTISPECIES: PoNe immunity protein domain-containing protein [unclassified Pseudoclavibacter]KAB1645465.1 DUF1911 domain-containing protein [Pseudoclavibacter sp. CFCC 14310]KAB1646076.1 DUF1911 domain-containing protein [Pseudoclavibacter sp. CFCC 14310]KAB1663616.1 DUF1911 domain-containing protein [Pseudoclavibacter sp. CFCC 13611]